MTAVWAMGALQIGSLVTERLWDSIEAQVQAQASAGQLRALASSHCAFGGAANCPFQGPGLWDSILGTAACALAPKSAHLVNPPPCCASPIWPQCAHPPPTMLCCPQSGHTLQADEFNFSSTALCLFGAARMQLQPSGAGRLCMPRQALPACARPCPPVHAGTAVHARMLAGMSMDPCDVAAV